MSGDGTIILPVRTTDPGIPATGKVKLYDKNGLPFWIDENGTVTPLGAITPQFEFEFTAGAFTTSSGSPVSVNAFTTPSLPAGTYKVECYGEVDVDIGDTARFFLEIEGTEEAQVDVAGTDSDSNDYSMWMSKVITFGSAGTRDLELLMSTRAGATCGIRARRLSIERVA